MSDRLGQQESTESSRQTGKFCDPVSGTLGRVGSCRGAGKGQRAGDAAVTVTLRVCCKGGQTDCGASQQ